MGYKATIAILMPELTGGTGRHAKEMAESWSKQGHWVVWIRVIFRIIRVDILYSGKIIHHYDLFFTPDLRRLVEICKIYDVKIIHFEHMLDLETVYFKLPQWLKIPAVVTLHDYYTICPFINLADEDDCYCGEPGLQRCQKCLKHRKYFSKTLHREIINIQYWRNFWHSFLQKAALVVVPDEDVKTRLQCYFSDLQITVSPNPELQRIICNYKRKSEYHKIRIGVLGFLTRAKGGEILLKCALLAEKENLPIEFVLFGDFDKVMKRIPSNLQILGKYKEEQIYRLITKRNISYFWFPALVPETYSYTLSIPIRLGIPVVSTNLGAIQRRILANKWGEVYSWQFKPRKILGILKSFNFKKYDQARIIKSLKNLSYPSSEDYYMGIPEINMESQINIALAKKMQKVIYDDLQEMTVYNLNGKEWKFLSQRTISLRRKVQLIFKLDFRWGWTYLKNHSLREIIQKISS